MRCGYFLILITLASACIGGEAAFASESEDVVFRCSADTLALDLVDPSASIPSDGNQAERFAASDLAEMNQGASPGSEAKALQRTCGNYQIEIAAAKSVDGQANGPVITVFRGKRAIITALHLAKCVSNAGPEDTQAGSCSLEYATGVYVKPYADYTTPYPSDYIVFHRDYEQRYELKGSKE